MTQTRHNAAGSRLPLALDAVHFRLQLGDPLKLHVEIAAYVVHHLTTLIQEVDDVVQLSARNIATACFRNTREAARSSRHWGQSIDELRILLLSPYHPQVRE